MLTRLPGLLLLCCCAATASAQSCPPHQLPLTLQGTHNPFLAGQPNGTPSKTDTAPSELPFLVPIPVQSGQRLSFTNVLGDVSNGSGGNGPGPDGDANWIVNSAADLGISGFNMPINCLLGVFLSDTTNSGPAPPDLDFSSTASVDYAIITPALHQTFFIGDGLRNDLFTTQSIVAPKNATRLFLGSADGYGWANNSGQFTLFYNHPMPMMACPKIISLASGGNQNWILDAGEEFADSIYLTLGSLAGTSPGFPIDGIEVPLAIDSYSIYTLYNPNTPPLSNSVGLLNTKGKAVAGFSIPPGIQTNLVGHQLFHAFLVIKANTSGLYQVSYASNPTTLGLSL